MEPRIAMWFGVVFWHLENGTSRGRLHPRREVTVVCGNAGMKLERARDALRVVMVGSANPPKGSNQQIAAPADPSSLIGTEVEAQN